MSRAPQLPPAAEESGVTVTPYPETGGAKASPLHESEAPQPLAESESPPPSTAVVALLDTASQQTRAGKLDNAAATLERALRLEPRNAELWTRLAEVRLKQGQLDQAAGLAAKSNNLAGNNAGIITRNLKILEQVRARKGGTIQKPR
ncbi:MAG: tetratricopeptide repeat protein [Proteobacteria bacterium]|nr:tetratricopeptide repeat protein [Pseudomonadota bacterium]